MTQLLFRFINKTKWYIGIALMVFLAFFFLYLQGYTTLILGIGSAVGAWFVGYLLDKVFKNKQNLTKQVFGLLVVAALASSALWLWNPDFDRRPCIARPGERAKNNEALIILTKFEQMSGSQLEPEREWEIVLNQSITEINNEYHDAGFQLRLLRIDRVVSTTEEAQYLGKCYNAVMVVGGSTGKASVLPRFTMLWSQQSSIENLGQPRFFGNESDIGLYASLGSDGVL